MSEPKSGQSAAPDHESDAAASSPPRWLRDLREAIAALRELAAAQVGLLRAELRVAQAAAHTAMLAALAATVFAVALGLTLLALIGWGFAQWFGSWLWALLALAALQVVGVIGAIFLVRWCFHLMSLPRSRAQLQATVRESWYPGKSKHHGSDKKPD